MSGDGHVSSRDGRLPVDHVSSDGEVFPLSMTLKILAVALVVFTVIPYLGVTMKPAGRTDLGWWRSGSIVEGKDKMLREEEHSLSHL